MADPLSTVDALVGGSAKVQVSPTAGNGSCSSDSAKISGKADFCVGSSRSSIKHFYDVISSFNEQKRELVRSIGFEGVLLFPALRQINRKFAVWLMSRVDPLYQTLSIHRNKRIKFGKVDVQKVFGIPCHGRSIFGSGTPSKESVSKIMRMYLGADSKENRSIKSAQEVVERKHNHPMTSQEQDAFKVAFVIYVMSTLLSPGSKYDYISVDYWNALLDPSEIVQFDWAEFVIKKLFQAVVKIKYELNASNKVSNIAGCSVFLQVLYLDSIDIGVLNIDHSSFPRIRHFSSDTMKSMILADTLCGPNDANEFEYGKSQLREGSTVCYSWGCDSFAPTTGRAVSNMYDLWHVACSFSSALGVHIKAAGPLFFVVAEFDGLSNSTTDNHAAIVASVLSGVIHPFTRGFSYNAGRSIEFGDLGPDISTVLHEVSIFVCSNWKSMRLATENSLSGIHGIQNTVGTDSCRCSKKARLSSAGRSTQNSPIPCSNGQPFFNHFTMHNICRLMQESGSELNNDKMKLSMVVRAMARYYMSLSCMDRRYCTFVRRKIRSDYISRSVTQQSFDTTRASTSTSCSDSIPTGSLPYNSVSAADWPVMLHCTPKHIEVSIESFTAQLQGVAEVSMDMFDACIRRFKQKEIHTATMYPGCPTRHIFESVFLGSVLAGVFDVTAPFIRDQLIGSHIGYKIKDRSMLFFPAIVRHRWVSYGWCLSSNNIFVFDPICHEGNIQALLCEHVHVIHKVKNAIEIAVNEICNGWVHPWSSATAEIICCAPEFANCTNMSGYATAHFCFHFDGTLPSLTNINEWSQGAAKTLLLDALKLDENHGIVPEGIW